ncbi:hypothetical protein PR202_ga20888 [Eleusine coracana subsp. coracana]|uniref:FLZ-type domain-containing protein n=1 Tax=Eleusine coracana subsp. coracana TaxID=191504 RepID=A0AAV5CYY3_ELECO|nr:hypothetical protein PR202_ga20888 [Eleusine coracana subsp. coracana]
MMPGKRSGRPMRRTTSLTEFALPDHVLADVAEEEDEELQLPTHAEEEAALGEMRQDDPYGWAVGAGGIGPDWLAAYRARAAPACWACAATRPTSPPPRPPRSSAPAGSATAASAPDATPSCTGAGDTAFCSLECRQQHITIEEWKEQCTALSKPQADDPVKPAASERTDNTGAAVATTTGAGGGGMLAAA